MPTDLTPNPRGPATRRAPWKLLAAVAVLALAACAPPPRYVVRPAPATPPPSTQVYFYPTRGQTPAQQDRDRYECYSWAVQQTGFDPSAPQLAPHQRLETVAMPPAHDAAAGAVAGAMIGAIASSPRHTGGGAVAGAIAGAVIGGISDAARQEQAERAQEYYASRRDTAYGARVEQQAASYRRAMAACLEGRGYTVR